MNNEYPLMAGEVHRILGQVTIKGAEAERMVAVRQWMADIEMGCVVCERLEMPDRTPAPPVREVDPSQELSSDAESTG